MIFFLRLDKPQIDRQTARQGEREREREIDRELERDREIEREKEIHRKRERERVRERSSIKDLRMHCLYLPLCIWRCFLLR